MTETLTYCGVCGEPVLDDEESVGTKDRGTVHALCFLADESAYWPMPPADTRWRAVSDLILGLSLIALVAYALHLIAGAFA